MNRIIFSGLLVVCIITIGTLLFKHNQTPKTGIVIGILQTASHPALDTACRGFQDELKSRLGSQVHFVVKNAQGSIANAHVIAQQFAEDQDIDGILAIATPAAQAIAHIEHKKPIFIAAVTDPVELGLMGPSSNVCGSSDIVDSSNTVQLAIALVPHAKTASVLFSTSEASSATMAQQLQAHLIRHGLHASTIGITQETELPAALDKACAQTDIIITPIDNMIASTITFIAAQTQRAKKPLVVSDNLLVAKGALAAAGVDYTIAGKQAADCALKVLLEHKNPAQIPLERQSGNIVINKRVLENLKLEIPHDMQSVAHIIAGDQP